MPEEGRARGWEGPTDARVSALPRARAHASDPRPRARRRARAPAAMPPLARRASPRAPRAKPRGGFVRHPSRPPRLARLGKSLGASLVLLLLHCSSAARARRWRARGIPGVPRGHRRRAPRREPRGELRSGPRRRPVRPVPVRLQRTPRGGGVSRHGPGRRALPGVRARQRRPAPARGAHRQRNDGRRRAVHRRTSVHRRDRSETRTRVRRGAATRAGGNAHSCVANARGRSPGRTRTGARRLLGRTRERLLGRSRPARFRFDERGALGRRRGGGV